MQRAVIGVDLGGTNVRACAFDESGKALAEPREAPSRAQDGAEATLDALAQVIHQATADAQIQPIAVGIAIPGHVDDREGIVRWAPNFGTYRDGVFHYWLDVPIREPLRQRGILAPIAMNNDANLAALGEYRFGSGGNSARGLVMFTLGTGVGGGVVLNADSLLGQASGSLLLLGGNLGGVEIGHIVVNDGGPDCNAGSYGSIEAFCQRDAIVKRAVHRLRRGRSSLLNDLCGGDFAKVTPRMIAEAADQGDEVAIEVWTEVGHYLGIGIGNAITVFAPEVVAIGGQIARAGEWILGPARRTARNVAVPHLFNFARIVQAEVLSDAGMLGGAALAWQGAS